MKAAVRSKYGPPEVVSIKDVDKPIPKHDEVLVKVYATTVNRSDCAILLAKPFIMRFFTGLFKPRFEITGTDFAGQVEAVGDNIREYKIGERVMGFGGMGLRSHAQYLVLREDRIMSKIPAKLNYEQAAACIEGAIYAACSVNQLKLLTGQRALVNGATGAIGSSLIQVLKFYGVYVSGVCAGENIELVKSLGADKVIDYKTEDFTKNNVQYDFVFDTIANRSFAECKPLLTKHGLYIPSDGLHNLFFAFITNFSPGKKVKFLMPKDAKANFIFVKDLAEKGSFKPVIDRTYPFDKIVDAYNYVLTKQKIGNVIIKWNEL